jgi:hypothetical protein
MRSRSKFIFLTLLVFGFLLGPTTAPVAANSYPGLVQKEWFHGNDILNARITIEVNDSDGVVSRYFLASCVQSVATSSQPPGPGSSSLREHDVNAATLLAHPYIEGADGRYPQQTTSEPDKAAPPRLDVPRHTPGRANERKKEIADDHRSGDADHPAQPVGDADGH